MFEVMLQGKMNVHSKYNNNSKKEKYTNNHRNDCIDKNVKTCME